MILRRSTGGIAGLLIRDVLSLCGPGAELERAQEREWASATFAGARHLIDVRLPLSTADAPPPDALRALPDHEFTLPGEIVADCAVVAGDAGLAEDGRYWLPVRVELLTINAD